jgi:hypothetical protein
MPRIDIVRNPDGSVAFDPPVLFGAAIGDRIFWRNLDAQKQHWITLKGKPRDFWFRFPLAQFSAGRTADTSREIVLQQQTQDIEYVSFDETGVEGRITFSSFVG